MEVRDYLSIFKFKILKSGWVLLFSIFWFFLYAYIIMFSQCYPKPFLENAFYLSPECIPEKEFWPLPFNVFSILVWILAFILFKELVQWFISYTKRGKYYAMTYDSWDRDWIYNGKSRFHLTEPPIIRINSSRAGFLLKKYLWKNFQMDFEFRFLDSKTVENYHPNIGIIFRAKDLENYLMLEIINEEGEMSVKPHIRYSGMWEVMSKDSLKITTANLQWFKVSLIVIDGKADISIPGIGDYEWFLPTHVDVNHIEDGIKSENGEEESEEEFDDKSPLLPKIDFKESYGMVGFRAHLNQGAEVKNLTIKKV